MITLRRAQMRYKNTAQGALDVTVKNAQGFAQPFAPTWEMVMGHKQGRLTDAGYTEMYLLRLSALAELGTDNGYSLFKALRDFGVKHDNTVTFLCFCPDGKFCHTYLLIDFLCQTFPRVFQKGI